MYHTSVKGYGLHGDVVVSGAEGREQGGERELCFGGGTKRNQSSNQTAVQLDSSSTGGELAEEGGERREGRRE